MYCSQVGSAAGQHTIVADAAPVVQRAQEVTFPVVNTLIDQFEVLHTQDPDIYQDSKPDSEAAKPGIRRHSQIVTRE